MQDAKEKQFGDITITLNPLLGLKALRVFHKLSKSVLPALTKAFGSFDTKAALALSSIDLGKIGEAIETFFLDCKEDEFVTLSKDLLTNAFVKTDSGLLQLDEGQINMTFQGRVLTLLEVLVWAVTEVHFADFLGKLPALKARAQALSQKTNASTSEASSPRKTASSGPSGA